MSIINKLQSASMTARKIRRKILVKKSNKSYFKKLKDHGIPLRELSSEQKKQIDGVYKKYNFKYGYDTHRLIYSVTGNFDPYFMPEDMFRQIELKLNDPELKGAWSDKSYFDFFFPEIRFPVTVVRNIAGTFYDKDYNIISAEKAKEIVSAYDKFAIKPSLDNGTGKGVALGTKEDDLDKMFKKYKRDYVIQEVIKQHKNIAQFNESSVNVVRFISLFVNDRVVPVMAALRVGAKGAFNDNSISKEGEGMLVIGIDEKGCLKKDAYMSCGMRVEESHSGVRFEGVQIPGFEKMKEIIVKGHSKMPNFKFVAWDFAVDENGEVLVMEYNIKGPGVLYYQYVNGPLFAEYTDELLKYVQEKL